MVVDSNAEDLYVPSCNVELKPLSGRKFKTLEEAIACYDNYASEVGFETRKYGTKSSGNIVIWQYIVCNREGSKNTDASASTNAREGNVKKSRRLSRRCECKARISIKYFSDVSGRGYYINQFVEEHNHAMVEQQHKRFMKSNRNIDIVHRKFIEDCAKASIGPSLTYNLLNEFLGGYDDVGCTIYDVRNYTRDMKAHIEGSDSQMLLNELRRRKESMDGFYYDFEVDDEDKLKRLFWSDVLSRKNFHMFGDVVAFDTTYSTNRYCMIFTLLTGKDNHGNPVSFGAGLLSKEDADSFSWLFKHLIACMGVPPNLIVTDQDLGMKAAIERTLVGTRHRWCMWHIMLKLADKVCRSLHSNEEFKKELNSCVWSDLIEPIDFENSWNGIIEKYGLEDNEWLKIMYENRKFWVPSYFRDFKMGSLIRTTSISESENCYFKRYAKPRANFAEFIMNYSNAIDAQRNRYEKLNYIDYTTFPSLETCLPIEKHAASLYTNSMFSLVQGEIVEACFKCRMVDIFTDVNYQKYSVIDGGGNNCVVECIDDVQSYECSCKLFGRKGMLCSHIFFVIKNKNVKLIPEKYYNGRWLKSSLLSSVHFMEKKFEEHVTDANDKRKALNNLYSTFYRVVKMADGDIKHIYSVTAAIEDVGKHISGGGMLLSINDKKKMVEAYFGMDVPDEVYVHNPNIVKTKGSGSRLISRKEKAIRQMNKPTRRCAKCNEMGHHDARNCDKFKEKTNN